MQAKQSDINFCFFSLVLLGFGSSLPAERQPRLSLLASSTYLSRMMNMRVDNPEDAGLFFLFVAVHICLVPIWSKW
jgi:hypothetical protein